MSLPGYLPHNHVKLIKGGSEYFELLERMIREAKRTVYVQVYIFDEDDTGKRIAHALIEAARRKVDVYVLLDAYASQGLSGDFVDQLKKAGIHFRWFDPLLKSKHFYFGRRLHHKVIVTDTSRSLVGGMNISDRYNDTVHNSAWLDWALYAEGEVSAELEKVCRRMAKVRRKKNWSEAEAPSISLPSGDQYPVRIRINDWVRRKMEITRSYLEMFRDASSHIIIMSPYFIPGYHFRRRIKQATRRGVKVQVILAGVSDIAIAKHAERFVYRWLLKNNVEIYEYQKNVLHGKVATFDRKWVTIGSYNVNNLSTYVSVELNLDVKHEQFAAQVEQRLRSIIEKDCVRITEDVYETRTGLVNRVLQRAAYDTFRVLFFLFTFYFKQRE
jgi:cardiolipin synthase